MNKKGEFYCYGCGVKLQFNNRNKEGYITEHAFETSLHPLCYRCFNIKYYNRISDVEHLDKDYSKLFENIIKSRCLVVYVIDIFNFNIDIVNDMLLKLDNKVIFVINKVDVLPKSVKKEKVITWIKSLIHNDHVIKFIATSAQDNFNIDELREEIEKYRNGRSVYFVGSTNAGKSSIINMFLKNYENNTDKFITTSCYANTTLQIVEIPLDKKSYIFDTPGFIEKHNIASEIEPKIMKSILPKKEIKPAVYQINSKQSLYIGGLFRIDVEPINKGSLIIYGSNKLKIHRSKKEKSNDVFNNLINNKQLHPVSGKYLDISHFDTHDISITEDKVDLVCSGYCIITLRNFKNTTVKVYVPKNVDVNLVDSLI